MTEQRSYRPLVYICSKYAGDVEGNLERTRAFCRFALEQGQIPLSGVLALSPVMDDSDPEERGLALFMDLVLMGKCDEVWVLGDEISAGMAMEIERAKKRRQKIRYFTSSHEEVDVI